jgi:hypothetical protein
LELWRQRGVSSIGPQFPDTLKKKYEFEPAAVKSGLQTEFKQNITGKKMKRAGIRV